MLRALAALVAALVLATGAAASDGDLLRIKRELFPRAAQAFRNDSDGLQARYDAARDLEEAAVGTRVGSPSCRRLRAALLAYARAQVRSAEAADYPRGAARPRLPDVPAGCTPGGRPTGGRVVRPSPRLPTLLKAAPEQPYEAALAARLATIGRGYRRGWAGFWVHDLVTGRTAGWNADARFPAASTVKLGVVAAGLRAAANPLASIFRYDLEQIGAWSSNLGANRIVGRLGYERVTEALRRLGMWSSTYPGPYRIGTSVAADAPNPPPQTHSRVTTAHDLGRALLRLHAAALGNRLALRQTGLSQAQARVGLAMLLASRAVGANVGLLRPSLSGVPIAQKNGWISDTRITAAIVYASHPTIVVVEAYRPDITSREAGDLGKRVVEAVF